MTYLNDQQKRFVEEYLVDMNAAAAARRAGYAAEKAASRLMRTLHVRAAIDAALEARSERTQITSDWVLEQMVEMYERCIAATPVLDAEGKPTGVWQFDVAGALKAIDLIAKYTGTQPADKVELTGKDGGPIVTKEMSENEIARRVAFVLEKGLRAQRAAVDGFDDLLH